MPNRLHPHHRVMILTRREETVDPLTFLLNIAGHEVLAVDDPSKAVEAASEFHPTVCLLEPDDRKCSDSRRLARELRSSSPDQEMILGELGSHPGGAGTEWNIDLKLSGEENNFQIVEKLEQ